MDLKKLGSSGVAFLLMLNSASMPATLAVADENVEIVSEGQEEQYTADTLGSVSTPAAEEPPKVTEPPATPKPVEPTQAPATEKPVETTQAPATEKPVEPTQAPATEKPVETTQAPATPKPAETTATTENPEPTETVKPTESAAPTESVKPTESVAPTESVKPTESAAPTESVKPTESVAPTESVKPTESAAPTESVKPTESAAPTESVKPTESAAPTESVKPTESVAPTESVKPTESAAPTESVKPTESAAPTESVEPTGSIAPTESPAPTEAPIPLALHDIAAEKSTYAPGECVVWHFACEGAESVRYEIRNHGNLVQEGELTGESEIRFQTEECGAYTLMITATAGEESVSGDSTVYVTNGDVSVSMSTNSRYAVANVDALGYQVAIGGGIAPYTVDVRVLIGGCLFHEESIAVQDAGTINIGYMPTVDGVHSTFVTVTDAAGTKAETSADLPVALRVQETAEEWQESVNGAALTGDWRSDLVAVAQTQLGYAESTQDFIINEAGAVEGYTRYGMWYGAPYGEWCGMFVSFCLNYANIPETAFPRSAHCGEWVDALNRMGLYEESNSGYVPTEGDLVFFNWEGDGSADHVGIVESVSGGAVNAIMGNAGKLVQGKSYALGDASITGYGSMEAAMRKAGLLEDEKNDAEDVDNATGETESETISLEARWEGETLGVGDTVTLTAQNAEGALLWQYMDENGAWQLAQEGGESFAFEVTEENCAWSWRAIYAGDSANAEGVESAEGTEGAENSENVESAESTESTEETESTENTESAESTESAENTESVESTESVGDTTNAESAESAESTENSENT